MISNERLVLFVRNQFLQQWNQAPLYSEAVGIPIELKGTLLFLSAGVLF